MTEVKRYVGVVVTTKNTYGFIHCDDFPRNLFYHKTDCLPDDTLYRGDVVTFSLRPSKMGGDQATDVRLEVKEKCEEEGGDYENSTC